MAEDSAGRLSGDPPIFLTLRGLTLYRGQGGSRLTTQRFRIQVGAVLVILAGSATATFAQYLGYCLRRREFPRGPDGKPDMTAPAPRTSDGHPDFTGMYGWVTRANCGGAKCNDTQIPSEFINIASSSLKSRALPAEARGVGYPKGARSGTG